VNPPPGSNFYPIYTTGTSTQNPSSNGHCVWQLGGPYSRATNTSAGAGGRVRIALFSFYPNPNPAIRLRTNNFRQI
jgi:hypothetical protein